MAPPSEKDRKFDRQLRLWASSGQSALENAHVALVGATSVGSELLKDLILPNIGKFTIIDDNFITEEDCSANFFVEADSLGKPKAQIIQALLNELNVDAQGSYVQKSLKTLLAEGDSSFWQKFSVVVASGGLPNELRDLSQVLWELNIPLVVIDSLGFFGSIFVSIKEHTVIESHPTSLVDLRLDRPWPELLEFTNKYNIDELDEVDHAHVPYVVLLLKYLGTWKASHGGSIPKSFKEKKEFKDLINSKRLGIDQENYDEAVGASWRLFQDSSVPSEISQILERDEAKTISSESSKFWVLVHALRSFVALPDSGNRLPLSGVLPDMKADTKGFISMQNVYLEKAKQDRQVYRDLLDPILASIGRPKDLVTQDEVETFCKNSRYLKATFGSNLNQIAQGNFKESDYYSEQDNDLFHIHVAILAVKQFTQENGYTPGVQPISSEDDEKLATIALKLVQDFGGEIVHPQTTKVIQEICRIGCYELHNTAAFMGGIGAQEVVKILTHQYSLLDNLAVFDGIQSKIQTWRL